MSMMSHFETLTPGMKAILDPRYRILQRHEYINYYELMMDLLQSGRNMDLPFTAVRKASDSLGRGAYGYSKLY